MNEETQKRYDERVALMDKWHAACWNLLQEGLGLPDEELTALTATILEHTEGVVAIKAYCDECRRKELAKKGPRISIQET